MKIAAFGEMLWDIIGEDAHLGGAPLNFAAHAAKCGLPSTIISAHGDDTLGWDAREKVSQNGVNIDFLQVTSNETGTVQVELDNGQPQYTIHTDVAYDNIDIKSIDFDRLEEYNCFYFGTLAQRNQKSRDCLKEILDKASFDLIFLDVNLRQQFFDKEILDYSIENCTIVKINDEEVKVLSQLLFLEDLDEEVFARRLVDEYKNLATVIITRGEKGAAVLHLSNWSTVASEKIIVGDTIGAGDSFSAAFSAHFLKNNDAKEALTFANKIGAFVASSIGAMPDYNSESFL